MPLRHVLTSFLDGTTIHGVPKIYRARTPLGRIGWALVCSLALGMFIWQTTELFIKFSSYPKNVNIEVVRTQVSFPAVTVCNHRNMDSLTVDSLRNRIKGWTLADFGVTITMKEMDFFHSFSIDQDFTGCADFDGANRTNGCFFERKYLEWFSKNFKSYFSGLLKLRDQPLELLGRTVLAGNLGEDLASMGGIDQRDLIMTCIYGGKKCNWTKTFTKIFDPYFLNCYTFNPGSDNMVHEGIGNGLSLILFTGSLSSERKENYLLIPGVNDFAHPSSGTDGVRVIIHSPDVQPQPSDQGFDVGPGQTASIGVTVRLYDRIGAPYGNCTTKAREKGSKYQYTSLACYRQCLQMALIRECGCMNIVLPAVENPSVPYCQKFMDLPKKCATQYNDTECFAEVKKWRDQIYCMNRTIMVMSNNLTEASCHCPPACHETFYDFSYSAAKWPARDELLSALVNVAQNFNMNPYSNKALQKKYKYFPPLNDVKLEYMWSDFVRLNVYMADSDGIKITESKDYEWFQLLSEVGGQLGLWVGISVITLFEVFELCGDIFRYLFQPKPKFEHRNYNGRCPRMVGEDSADPLPVAVPQVNVQTYTPYNAKRKQKESSFL